MRTANGAKKGKEAKREKRKEKREKKKGKQTRAFLFPFPRGQKSYWLHYIILHKQQQRELYAVTVPSTEV